MSTPGIVLFVFCGLWALVSAIGTVAMRSPIRAAMSLLVHILALSGLFLTLHAHLLAVLQLLIYAGAVVVLFVFVIMMIGPGATDAPAKRGMVIKAVAASLMGIVTVGLTAALCLIAPERGVLTVCTPEQGAECAQFGGVGGFSSDLFVNGILPFELISILLTVAIVGAIAVARGHTALEAETARRLRLEREARDAEKGTHEPVAAGQVVQSRGH
jgi:NADH-quinone oxidoreductase subunit J